ncbi:MAG: TonB-dependent receptor, partial [Halioglobus sp.]|nr:TonB-dependent receptor [Halioglobus sp.]
MNTSRKAKSPVQRSLAVAVRSALAAGACVLASGAVAQEEESKGRYSLVLEEVVVTAQKREEDFMTVPVTVNAFTSQDMINTGAATIQDIDAFMPGVETGDAVGGSTQNGITVRGVSSPNISSGQDPSVATFYDGSYMPRAVTSIPFTDIERTEVLKGPQGTLFGRNSTAGVINIVPNKPGNEFEGFVKTRLGNQERVRVEGMVNAPVADNLALRGNLFFNEQAGFTKSATNGGDFRDEGYWAARAVALFTPTVDTEIQLAVDYEDRDELPRPAIGVSPYAFRGSDDPFRSKDQHDVAGAGTTYDTERNNEEETREMFGVSLKLDQTLNEDWSMFAIASYREWDTTNLQEEDGTPDPRRYLDTNNIEESDIFYTELRFNYVDSQFNIIAGGNYSQEDVFQRTDIGLLADSYMQFVTVLGGFGGQDTHLWYDFDLTDEAYLALSASQGIALLPPSFEGTYFTETMDNTGDFINWGVFVDGSYQVCDTVRLSAGLRYSYDEKEYSWQTFESMIDYPFAPERVNYQPRDTGAPEEELFDKFTAKDDWSKVTGRFVADWQFTDFAMTYLSVATGYKSGGFDGQSFKSFVSGSFDPEEMTSIELGIKGDFFDDSVRVELAVFHHELDGRQRSTDIRDSADDPTAAPGVVSSDEEADGVEVIVTWNVTDTLRLGGLTSYRETESISEEFFNADGVLSGGDKTT